MSETIENAAKAAELEIENITGGEFAFVKGTPHTPEGFLSGKPILLGQLKRGGKTNFYTISFREKEHEDVAVIRNLDGHEVDELSATIYVPRRPRMKEMVRVLGCNVQWGDLSHGGHYILITCPKGVASFFWWD